MNPAEFGQIAVNAVLLSGILALVALGFSLVWGIMNIVNLSHGAFVVLGAYLTFFLHELVGLDPFVTIPIVMFALFLLGFGVQQVLINQVIRAPLLATGMDIDAARLTGVKVAQIYALTFAIGASLAGGAGSLLSMIVPFDPNLGETYTQRAFVICVLGGLGDVGNVILGAILYAFVDVFVGARLPEMSQAFTFGVLVLLLVLRPQGIAGKKLYA